MDFTSPLANPQPYITKVNDLSKESITIDEGVARATREAADFVSKFANNFKIVSDLQASTDKFSVVRFFFFCIINVNNKQFFKSMII